MRSRGERNNWKGLDQKLTLYGSGHRKINRWWKGNEQWVDLKRVVLCRLWEKRVNKLQMSIGNRLTNEEREMACELWKIGVKNKNKCYFTEKSWETKKKNGRRKRRSMCYPQEYREVNVYYIGREDYSNGPDSFFSFLSAVCTFVYFLRPNPSWEWHWILLLA